MAKSDRRNMTVDTTLENTSSVSPEQQAVGIPDNQFGNNVKGTDGDDQNEEPPPLQKIMNMVYDVMILGTDVRILREEIHNAFPSDSQEALMLLQQLQKFRALGEAVAQAGQESYSALVSR